MSSSPRWSHRLALLLACFILQVSASIRYCSSINTASTNQNRSIYQSNGLCYYFCMNNYSFAVLQDDSCWCSNYVPGTTVSVSECNKPCPGYPSDLCGGKGLFGYIELYTLPSGTKGGSSSPQPTDAPPGTVTVYDTATISDSRSSSSSPSTTSSSTSLAAETTVAAASIVPTFTWMPTPVVSLETVTGQVRTVTVTPTVPPNQQSLNGVSKKSSGIGTGAMAGLVVGVIVIIAMAGGFIFYWLRRRRAAAEVTEFLTPGSQGSGQVSDGPIPSRTMSENSRYVLGTDGRQVVETWEPDRNTPGQRRSRLMPVDPRLDPFAPVYQRGDNKSHESVNTLRDDHDYSRRVHHQPLILRATNPDV